MTVDDLAQEIRRIDGRNDLGAGSLAEALMPFLASRSAPEAGKAVVKRLPIPDGVSMTGGLICLGYEDNDERDLAYDALEAYGAGDISALASPAPSGAAKPCGLANPSQHECRNMLEVGGGMEGERYHCAICGKGYFLDYEDMK